MWNVGADGAGVSEVIAACGGGLKAVLGDHVGLVLGGEGATTLGELRGLAIAMGEQVHTMTQRFLEAK